MAEQIIQKLLKRRCSIWPECACHRLWLHWQERLEEDRLTFDELAAADMSIFYMLSCVSEHCPERKVQASASVQLLNSWWDRQRREEELTKEFCEARRAQG